MATSLVYMPATAAILPTSSAPGVSFTSGTNFPYITLAYALNEKAYFHTVVPDLYASGTVDFRVYWTPDSGTSGSATWGIKYLGRIDDEALDAALSSQTTVADAVTAVGDLQVATVSISSPTLAAGDYLIVELELTSALTGGDALVHGVQLLEQ